VLSGASAFLNTSLVDNQPVSVIEAFAAGVPVISSNVGGVPDLIASGVNGLLFPARDVNALVEQMTFITEHPGVARELASNARATAERFSWPAVFRQLRRIYA
jgi:phenylacetate-CoA ligase